MIDEQYHIDNVTIDVLEKTIGTWVGKYKTCAKENQEVNADSMNCRVVNERLMKEIKGEKS